MSVQLILMIVIIMLALGACVGIWVMYSKLGTIMRTLTHQHNIIVKMQATLRSKSATNAITENSEMVYQYLLQNLIPVMAAIDIMPRNTSEHPLWRAIGGILDEYAKNPFVLEKLRRAIKLNTDIARNVDGYIASADKFLAHLTTTDPDGILAATFTDGLMGQSLTFFAQARQLATQSGGGE